MKVRFSVLFCLCLLISKVTFGSSHEKTHYESYGEVDLKGAKFAILPADENISATDPKFVWFAQQTAPYFELYGANYVTSVEDAELVLLLDYGIGETTPRTYTKPVWGRTGISSSSTTIRGNKINTTYFPAWGVIGYNQHMENQYRKHIEMYLYDANTENGMTLLWQASMEVVGNSNNLKKMFPAIVYDFGVLNSGICKMIDEDRHIFKEEWDVNCNYFLQYSTNAIAEHYYTWRALSLVKSHLNESTMKKQYAKEFMDRAYAICPAKDATSVFFRVFLFGFHYTRWKLSDLSNIFIEYEGKKYYAKRATGLKKDKKLYDDKHITFVLDFEQLPEEVWYGKRYITIKEEKKGKVLQGWDVTIEQE